MVFAIDNTDESNYFITKTNYCPYMADCHWMGFWSCIRIRRSCNGVPQEEGLTRQVCWSPCPSRPPWPLPQVYTRPDVVRNVLWYLQMMTWSTYRSSLMQSLHHSNVHMYKCSLDSWAASQMLVKVIIAPKYYIQALVLEKYSLFRINK